MGRKIIIDLLMELCGLRKDVRRLSRMVYKLKGALMADLSQLNAAINANNQVTQELGTTLTDALNRVDEDVQALKDAVANPEDQNAIDAAAQKLEASTSAMRESVNKLAALDPVPTVEEPTEPTEPTEPEEPVGRSGRGKR